MLVGYRSRLGSVMGSGSECVARGGVDGSMGRADRLDRIDWAAMACRYPMTTPVAVVANMNSSAGSAARARWPRSAAHSSDGGSPPYSDKSIEFQCLSRLAEAGRPALAGADEPEPRVTGIKQVGVRGFCAQDVRGGLFRRVDPHR